MMIDMWFKLKEISKDIKTLQAYSDLWDFVRRVANEDSEWFEFVNEANKLIKTYQEIER